MTATTAAPDTARPRVSVVVPTCHRVDLLDRCVEALLRQSMPPSDYEIIIVDDLPCHHTRQLVAMWSARAARHGHAMHYLANSGVHGPAAARNAGWRRARAPIIAFTDDDAIAVRCWLSEGLLAFAQAADAVCGRIEIPVPARPTDYQRDASRLERADFSTANCFLRVSVLESLGGFDERFRFPYHEDSDLYFRLLDKGGVIVRAPRAMVIHPVRPAPWGASVLQLKKVACDALLYKKHPLRYRAQIGASAPWNYYLIAAALAVALAAMLAGIGALAVTAWFVWLVLTALLCARRLRGTLHTPSHVAEVLLTSALLPTLAVFWRVAGAVRYRVRFA